MKIVDLDAMFQDRLIKYLADNPDARLKEDELDDVVSAEYLKFLNERIEELDALSPSEYFAGITSAQELVDGMREYEDSGVEPPQLMLERLTEMGAQSVKPLMRLLMDEEACECLRVTAVNILTSIGSDAPMGYCMELIDSREDEDALADAAAEFLQSLGEKPVKAMLDRLEDASASAKCTYLDILCNFPGDERIYIYMMREFITDSQRRALYASFLGKLGDERAIKALTAALDLPDVDYLDYMEIRNSIEMLGGEVTNDRVFDGDRYYETLKNLDDGEEK